jgi:hypothetical protein
MKRNEDQRGKDPSKEGSSRAKAEPSASGAAGETESEAEREGATEGEAEGEGTAEGEGAAEDEGEGAAEDEGAAEGDEAEEPAEDAAEDEPEEPSLWAIIRDSYLSFDRRTLGFTRILLGFLLITDLIRRTWAWEDMFSTEGVLPNHVNLWRPQAHGAFSFVNAFSTPGELWVLWAIIFATFLCVLVGYKTRLAQVLSMVFVTSMNGRILLIENGGYVVYNLLLMWTCFLPMGDRFSLDALLASLKERRESTEAELNDRAELVPPENTKPFVSVVGIIILIQIAAIYFFNVVHKTGPAWKNGTAVHYVLYVDRMVTPLIGVVRDYLPLWFIIFLTKFVLAAEAAIPVALLSPLGRVWARRLAIVLMNALHLGFGTVFVLGPFAWALCVFSTLLFGREDWELAIRTMRRPHRARVVLYDPGSGAAVLACRVFKRLDHFELLTFREEPGLPTSIAVTRLGGAAQLTRSLAFADMISAVPLGPIVAWKLRLPGVRHAVDALLGSLEGGRLSRFFGLRGSAPSRVTPEPEERAVSYRSSARVEVSTYIAPEPAPLRLKGRRVLAVLRELAVLAMFAGAVNQAMVELWVVNRRIKVPHPEPLRILSHKLRFLQGWFMFSPNPVMDDGTIVVDALTVDGRHIDPFTGKEPNWDLSNAKSLRHSQIWCDYFNRMHLSQNSGFRDAMKEYMYRLPQRTGRPEDAIVSGEVYWVQDMNPKWGEHVSFKYEKVKLFSFENPKAKAQAAAPPPGPVPDGKE